MSNEVNISVRLKSKETKQVTRRYTSDWPYEPYAPCTEAQVTEYTLVFGVEGSDRYVVLRGWDEDMIPESMRNAALDTPFRLRLESEL